MEPVVKTADNRRAWTIVSDDNCPVVRFLTRIIRSCDKNGFFNFVGHDENIAEDAKLLLKELAASQWSLLLIDDLDQRIHGPEAIPFILKNLPQGRLACAAYLIPGTMWLTRQLYLSVSRNRKKIATLKIPSAKSEQGQTAA